MRKRVSVGGLTVNAIAGSHVVLLGFDVAEEQRAGLRGFAIRRTDVSEQETYWLSGTKVFASLVPQPASGVRYSSLAHPFQSFQWADYSAKPGRRYLFRVVAMYGDPGSLKEDAAVEVEVVTEPVEGAAHTVNFNRGSPATQEYARRFQNRRPEVVGQEAYDWLSRGLVESVRDFIRRAVDGRFALKGAFYEFQWPAVLEEFRAARARGVKIEVIYDDIDAKKGPHQKNDDAIAAAKIKGIVTPRTNGKLMHNKFIVLVENDAPRAVLFGSTNLTENGLFGHANCTHVVENPEIARAYLNYHAQLADDPETGRGSPYKKWVAENSPTPATDFVEGMAPVFSPRAGLAPLDWYTELAGSARKALFMTFAFGMAQPFREVYASDDDVLRFALMEKEWNGGGKDKQIAAIRKLQARPNVTVAIGNYISLNKFDQWVKELNQITDEVWVRWVHLKFMLVDPLSDHPIVVTGSANFSESSTDTNDENMLVIKDDTRVADIYLGEYMRLYSHYAYREAVQIFLDKNPGATPDDMAKFGILEEHKDWTASYFDPTDRSARMARRLYFSGAEGG